MNNEENQRTKESNFDISNDFIPSSISSFTPNKKTKYKKGDKVSHKMFGEGVVIGIEDDMLKIAFSYPYGLKKINKSFKGLSKI